MGRYFWNAGKTATMLFYDGSAHVEERAQANNTLLRRYIHGPGADTPLVWYEGSGTTDRRWLIPDERGSIIAVTGASGAVMTINNNPAINRYDDYGVPAATNTGRFQYTGQAWLPELSMYYYKARIYSASLGRFMQTDPTGYDDGPNWYDYVSGDPVNKSDPTGTDAQIVIHNDRDVRIEIPLTYGGPANSPAQRQAFEADIKSTFSGRFGDKNVTTTVTTPNATDRVSANTVNFVRAGADTPSTVSGGRNATINVESRGISANERGHEGGHLLGNPDRYTASGTGASRTSTANSDYRTNIMGNLGQPADKRDIQGAISAPNNSVIRITTPMAADKPDLCGGRQQCK